LPHFIKEIAYFWRREKPVDRQVILGMGAGECGLLLLSQILSRQPDTRVTHEQLPWLPWERQPNESGIRDRLRQLLATANESRVGDVASFYLPYVEEAIQCHPAVRIICLKRPRDEVVAGFCRTPDQPSGAPVNSQAKGTRPDRSHDPFETQFFPQYGTHDREEGIERYWDEYYTAAEQLQRWYPDNVRVWDSEILTTEAGLREVLTFAGIPASEQVIPAGQMSPHISGSPTDKSREALTHADAAAGREPDSLDRRKCVILVPFSGFIHPECDAALVELERRGYPVRRVGGYAAIDQGRNQMATDALRDGFEETLWIDADIGFHPDAADQLRSHDLPIVSGVYAQKGKRALACHALPETPSITFGQEGGLVELLYAGGGFLLVRREVYRKVQDECRLPVCNERFGQPMIPFFQPLLRPVDGGHWYLAEDYAFCHRARESGFRIFADTSIRLWHIGGYRYGWEDAGIEPRRFNAFTLNLGDPPRPDPLADLGIAETQQRTETAH
jgi:hypothetical protein